jgi:cardiolipin synthase
VNPPHFSSPLAWLSRDHRKTLAVDGRVAFVSGLCVGSAWVGERAWRDTGVQIEGPAVADVERAFADIWRTTGGKLPRGEKPDREDLPEPGDMPVRVIASVPASAPMYRLDQLVAAAARETLWLTDAYFVATSAYVQALRSAAADGVDVRLLVPGSSDVPGVRALARAGYRPLLEAGVRVFEWNGSMLHAKTAVADARWARVGSTNLNPSSWLGNWELDVSVEHDAFAQELQAIYEEDLAKATEIVIGNRRRVRPVPASIEVPAGAHPRRRRRYRVGSRATAGALGIGSAMGAALTARRPLGAAEARLLGAGAILLLAIGLLALYWPRAITVPLAVISIWIALALATRAWQIHRSASRRENPDT